jgi:hypothetical protein
VSNSDIAIGASQGVDLSIIIVTYGAREVTFRCLESVARETADIACEVIIVDNGSPDGMAEEIASCFPRFCVHRQQHNLGFAVAGNIAANLARGAYLLFLNPDTIVLKGAFDRILAFARRRPGAGIWGGRTLFAEGEPNPASCRRRTTLWTLFCSALALDTRFPSSPLVGSAGYGTRARDSERSVDVVCGCFLLVDGALWDRLGGFSPAFFMYGEDDDLSYRARKLGFFPAFTPDSAIIHFGSGTETNKERKIRQILAARALYIRIHFSTLAKRSALALLTLRPRLGCRFARPELRNLWRDVWARRAQWAAGRFGS